MKSNSGSYNAKEKAYAKDQSSNKTKKKEGNIFR